jgi:signal transduction histidine kinase
MLVASDEEYPMTAIAIDNAVRSEPFAHFMPVEPDHGAAPGNVCAAMIAMVGHDLRQPLQVITSAHDRLARTPHDAGQRAELARAKAATSRLTRMLNQLVDAVQLQEQSSQCLQEPVVLRSILRQLTLEFRDMAQVKSIGLHVLPGAAVVWSNPVMLTSILRNLVRNAIDYTPRGGRVLVDCRSRGPEVHIEVRDSGIGIAPSELVKIFDAFHRADSTRADGLGLGLFIVQRTAEFLRHRIEVRSAPGRGSCFTIAAPRPFFDPASRKRWRRDAARYTESAVS